MWHDFSLLIFMAQLIIQIKNMLICIVMWTIYSGGLGVNIFNSKSGRIKQRLKKKNFESSYDFITQESTRIQRTCYLFHFVFIWRSHHNSWLDGKHEVLSVRHCGIIQWKYHWLFGELRYSRLVTSHNAVLVRTCSL